MGSPTHGLFFLDFKKAVDVFTAFFNVRFTTEAQRTQSSLFFIQSGDPRGIGFAPVKY
jgi:hypothetical protein